VTPLQVSEAGIVDFGVTEAILPGSADIGHIGDGGLGDGTGRIGPIRPRADVLDVRRAAGTDKRDATRINADAIEPAVLDALASFYRDHYRLIADAVIRAQARHLAGKDNQRAELAAVEAELTKINQAIDRYLNAFENSTLEEEDLAARLAPVKIKTKQFRTRRDELADQLTDVPQPLPQEALARGRRPHLRVHHQRHRQPAESPHRSPDRRDQDYRGRPHHPRPKIRFEWVIASS
jgi:hypothetical protein